MKKITFSLLLFLALVSGTYAQVQVGEGTNQLQNVPFEPYYGYTYAQSIYLASEINAAGSITSIKWYYSGTSTLGNNQDLVVYLGHTDYDSFSSNSDFIAVDDLTQVYEGGITVSGPGWVTITFDEPFEYDGTSNLVVAVDENMQGYNNSDDDFHNTAVAGNRSIFAYSDTINFDPADPNNNQGGETWDYTRGTAAFVPTIIFDGIQQDCTTPNLLAVSNITVEGATFTWQANAGETAWQVAIFESGSEAPDGSFEGEPVTGEPTFTETGLLDATNYQFYVRANCGSGFSSWAGPLNFLTQCLPFEEDFVENFTTTVTIPAPQCWSTLKVSSSANANIQLSSFNNFMSLSNSDDATAQLHLITPGLTALPLGTHRVKFRAYSFSTGATVRVGTMTDPTDASTFTEIASIPVTSTFTQYSVPFSTPTTDMFVAFKFVGTGTYQNMYIDDFIWEPIPTAVPECVADSNVTPNENCGNFATQFTWSAVDGADGYRISIGSTPGSSDVVENASVGTALTYSFTGESNTTYYYTITAFNSFGDAVDCAENEFTTAPDGCYCPSVPSSNDGAGITNVTINDSSFPNGDVTYFDYTEEGAVDITQGVNNIVNISFATGYSYHTNIWIDYNSNYTFEPSELVFQGESTNANPVVLNASFFAPLEGEVGEYRMRIGTADSGQSPPNPCYSGSYGVTLDFLVNVLPAPECLPPSAASVTAITANTAQLNWVSEGTLFNVEYGEAGFTPDGGGTAVNGVTANFVVVDQLEAQFDYEFYIQTDCGSGTLSPWTGPYSFRTACEAFDDFEEDFTTETTMPAPECWYTLKQTTDQFANVILYNYNDYMQLYNSADVAAELYLITPNLTSLPLATHRIRFTAFSYSANPQLIVGTMTDPTDASTFTAVQTVAVNSNINAEYVVPFTGATTDQYVAFKFVGTGTYQYMYVDNVVWEPNPTEAPACVADADVETNESCGNYANTITWTEVEGADFYTVTIGTETEELVSVNIGNATTYSFTGDFGVTYTYSILAGNTFGSAEGCEAGTFTTVDTGCHCLSVPTSNDGLGITNVLFNDFDFPHADVTYTDFSEEGDMTITQGEDVNLQVSFATGYTYNTFVFIDLNDDYNFDASEQFFAGESSSTNPTVYNASFTLPADAQIGAHRMRLVTYDYTATPLVGNPCYSGSYGVTVDFSVMVEEFLSTNEFNKTNLRVYPNPVKDILNLTYTQNISNVEVFNMLGQQVLTKSVNATQSQLDMSNLSMGTYLVKVTADNQVKTIKVVKQ